jgi:dTDP-glucose 4,6-dehydratase
MKILITGGCGAIGSVVLEYMLKKYNSESCLIINLDAQTYSANNYHIQFLKLPNYKFIKGNICDGDLVDFILDTYKPQIIIHLAAETHVDNSFNNSIKFTETNVIGTHTLLECAKKYNNLERFIHMSTDEVYGSVNNEQICKENSMFAPSNPYSATKAAAEMLCHAYIKSFNLPIIVVRCNNVSSPFQHKEKLIPHIITQLLSNNKVNIHGKGLSKRTFIDAYDIASALDIILINGENEEIYNIGTDLEFTVLEVVEKIKNILKPKDNIDEIITYIPDRLYQDYRYSIDSNKLINLGWERKINFDDSIKKVISYLTYSI